MKKVILLFLLSFSVKAFAQTQNWEANFLHNINPGQEHSSFQKNISNSVYPLSVAAPLTIFIVGLAKDNKEIQKHGLKIMGSLVINSAITLGIKYAVNRNRPYEDYPTLIYPYQVENNSSFPSGHTSTAFALATSLSLQYKKWYVVAPSFLYAAGVGYSRMYLGEHYPTDVIAGAAVGIGSAYLSEWLSKKIFKK